MYKSLFPVRTESGVLFSMLWSIRYLSHDSGSDSRIDIFRFFYFFSIQIIQTCNTFFVHFCPTLSPVSLGVIWCGME